MTRFGFITNNCNFNHRINVATIYVRIGCKSFATHGKVVQHVSLALELALLTSGPLPLLTPLLLLATLSKMWMTAISWEKSELEGMARGESIGSDWDLCFCSEVTTL